MERPPMSTFRLGMILLKVEPEFRRKSLQRSEIMNLKRAPIFVLLCALVFPACAGRFDVGIRRGLTASKITYEGAMDAVDKAERMGKISSEAAGVILEYESKHRSLHNLVVGMTEQYVSMRDIGQPEVQLKILEEQIINYQTGLVTLVAEMVVFLKEIGVM